MRRVLVTGAGGFIGRPVCRDLGAAGWEVIGTGRSAKPADFGEGHWLPANLLDEVEANRLVKSAHATHLLHLAWVTDHGAFWTSPENQPWLAASKELFRAFAAQGGRRIIAAGTCAEYDWTAPDPAAAPPNPTTAYGRAKLALHDWAENFCRDSQISFAWGRVFFAFGPRENSRRLVPYVINQLLRADPVLCASGIGERDFLYVDDLARLFAVLVAGDYSGAYDLGAGRGLTIRHLVEALARLAGRPDLPKFGARPDPVGEPGRLVARCLVPDIAIDANFPAPLDQSLQRTLEWWRQTTR